MRTASFAERTRSCARHRRISPRRSSTAARDDGVVHRRTSWSIWGRPICGQLPIAPSTYYEHKVREGQPERGPARVRRDGWLCGEIRRVYDERFGVYGVRKVWRELRREGVSVARCTVARRMRRLGLQGAVRDRQTKTTTPVADAERPADRVSRVFTVSRPDALWVSDLTPVSTGAGSTWPRGEGSSTPPWSSTPTRGASWAGGCRTRFAPSWPSMRSSRPFTTAASNEERSSIIPTAEGNTCRCGTPSAWRRPGSNPRWAG